jgi:hypothetical protein
MRYELQVAEAEMGERIRTEVMGAA